LIRIVLDAKQAPCADCGVHYPPYVLEFDHVRGVKVDDVSVMVANSCSPESLLGEIGKCDVVCANCHKTRHHFRRIAKSEGYLGRRPLKSRPRKGIWPDTLKLQEMVLIMPALQVAKSIGVSSVAVKRMCTRLGLETRPRGYWMKTKTTQLTPL
jgi:hypothetical protein